MPQLDRYTFVSQVIWLILVFLGMYFLLLKTGLPRIYKILNIRQRKLEKIKSNIVMVEKEIYILDKGVKGLVVGFLRNLKALPEQINKVIDKNMERRLDVIRKKYNVEREYLLLNTDEEKYEREMRLAKRIDEVSFIKDKMILKRKILN